MDNRPDTEVGAGYYLHPHLSALRYLEVCKTAYSYTAPEKAMTIYPVMKINANLPIEQQDAVFAGEIDIRARPPLESPEERKKRLNRLRIALWRYHIVHSISNYTEYN
uniref:Uncharacterized protein n=1 Tax=Anopheles culicifacies TaxID=139723 RepID=A0A182MH53_9DIPT